MLKTEAISFPHMMFVIRHGETEWNEKGIVIGQKNPPLSDSGRRQAHALAVEVMSLGILRIYASDLERAKESAKIVGETVGCEVITNTLLREASFGELEGRSIPSLIKEGVWLDRERDKYTFVPPGGESYQDVEVRIRKAFSLMQSDVSKRNLLIVTHVGVIRILHRIFARSSPEVAGALNPRHGEIWQLRWMDNDTDFFVLKDIESVEDAPRPWPL